MLNTIKIEDVTNVKSCIDVVRVIRAAGHLSLKEAKDIWDKAKEVKDAQWRRAEGLEDENAAAPPVFESILLSSEDTKLLLEKYGCKVSIVNNASPTEREILESKVRSRGGRIIWGDIPPIDNDNLKIKNPAGVHPIYKKS